MRLYRKHFATSLYLISFSFRTERERIDQTCLNVSTVLTTWPPPPPPPPPTHKHALMCIQLYLHLLSAYFAKNIVCALELGHFWDSIDISLLTPETAPPPLATHCIISSFMQKNNIFNISIIFIPNKNVFWSEAQERHWVS